ncbi:hypothetical protein Ctob_012534 [Chrysochromulina tobinii]|uniref:Uncharacterized protein n=1 Tax=Chrysochromulina tobinii TaxID=1460289 RepID=A0A0M0JU39_9EUKA|nr:hypothetical protein Ctob_012534 [Chrysochromulina tobinii]|eukprot:KOO30206.1 hypothetical protein Ctob_012534 [Chrysochromulina sp. CCMP291]
MPPYKMRDMTEERKNNFIALRQEVKVPDLIAMLLRNADAKQTSTLERTLSLYTSGQLRGPAAFTLCSNCVGLDNCKLAFVELVPGYMHEHSAFGYDHPVVV